MTGPRVHPLMLRLASARVAKGLTQTQVGNALGVTKNCICQWENGHNNGPKLDHLDAYARLVGLKLDLPEVSNA